MENSVFGISNIEETEKSREFRSSNCLSTEVVDPFESMNLKELLSFQVARKLKKVIGMPLAVLNQRADVGQT
jgi:hypothetical protein